MSRGVRTEEGRPPLTIACIDGLANRLRVLLSGIAISELTEREFTMLWPRGRACGATFPELFENDWKVVEISEEEATALSARGGFSHPPVPDLATSAADAPFRASVWLIPKDASWRARTEWNGECGFSADEIASIRQRIAGLLQELSAVVGIRERVAAIRTASFRPTMIGVHLRRGDFVRIRPEVSRNLDVVARHVDDYLEREPEAGILLCTDDGAPDAYLGSAVPAEGVREAFAARFPGRVVATEPRSLVRGEREAVEDALVDLLLLREASMFVGTRGSSFSELASFGRTIPAVVLGRGSPRDRVLRYTGVEAGIIGLGVLTMGRVMPAAIVMRQWRSRARAGLSRGGAK